MKVYKTIILSLLFFGLSTQADTLVLSSNLKLEYPTPLMISHTQSRLIIKYEKTAISHNIVNPKNMYPNIDLSGYQKDYIYTLFDKKINNKLPESIEVLALKQKEIMGLNNLKGILKSTSTYELLASFDKNQRIGHIFIIQEANIHHLAVDGDQDYLYKIIDGIKER
jgi:hypothetical protein